MSNLINPFRFGAAAPAGDFISQWKTDNTGPSNNDQITLPLVASGTYNFVVDWGDGSSNDTITAYDDAEVTHTFLGGADTYTVTITGDLDGWQFNNGGDKEKIILISNWGTFKPGAALGGNFHGCANLVITATDTLDLSGVTKMTSFFRGCTSIVTLDLSDADTSLVTSMDQMCNGNTSMTTIVITGWVTTANTTLNSTFRDCSSLTAIIGISYFTTANVTSMANMFRGCSSMIILDVIGFNTVKVNNMSSMFQSMSSVLVLAVGGFDTASVTTMSAMFNGASLVTNLGMDGADWDIGLVNNMSLLCNGLTLNTSNYDDILAAWAAQSPVQSGVTCSFGSSVYTIATAQADRDVLTDPPNSWTLTDGGGV